MSFNARGWDPTYDYYTPLDSRVADPDQFANVHDLQVMRSNHNILIAKRQRKNVFFQVPNSSTSGTPIALGGIGAIGESGSGVQSNNSLSVLFSMPILLTQQTKTLTYVIRACTDAFVEGGATAPSVTLWPLISKFGMPRPILDASSAKMTVTATSETKYSCTVEKPNMDARVRFWGPELWQFTVYFAGTVCANVTDLGAGRTGDVSDVGPDWVEIDTDSDPAWATGTQLLYSTTNTSIESRQSVGQVRVSSTAQRVFVDKPWNILPDVNTPDTFVAKEIAGLKIFVHCLYEDARSNGFGEAAITL